jgi:hypothetical protein
MQKQSVKNYSTNMQNSSNLLCEVSAQQNKCDSPYYIIEHYFLALCSLNKSNSQFSIKLNGNQRRKRIKHYSDLSLTKEIYQLPNDVERTNWDERDIRARNQYLYNEIVQIW